MSAETLREAARRSGGDLRGLTAAERALRLDLSTCVNRHGPHPAALRALPGIRPAELRAHPYSAVADFLDAYAGFLGGVSGAELLPLRGITEGLRVVRDLDPRATVICPDYTESLALFQHVPGSARDTVAVRTQRVADAMADPRCRTVVLSNPNNPLGLHIPAAQLAAIAAEHPDTVLVVDEAYADFLPFRDTLLGVDLGNVDVLRAPNKILGMAGVRTGAFWTRDDERAKVVRRRLLGWPLSFADTVMACASLDDPAWVEATRREILRTAAWMAPQLTERLGPAVTDSPVHFRFVHLPEADDLDRLRRHFGAHKITVRVFERGRGRAPGMRIVAPTAAERDILEAALAAIHPSLFRGTPGEPERR